MQTTITMNLAFGKPGEHANTQPYRADSYAAASTVTFGQPAYTGTGGVGAYDSSTRGTYLGLFVSPNEHVNMALPSNVATLSVPAGTTVAVAKRGSWFVSIPKVSGANDSSWTVGAKVYATAGVLTTTSAGGTLVGEILAVQNGSNLVASGNEFGNDTADVAIINLG